MQQYAFGAVAQAWAQKDPVAAANWLKSFPDGFGKAEGMRTVVRQWLQQNDTGVDSFVSNLPKGQAYDSAVRVYARHLAETQPQKAVQMAMGIENINRRNDALENIGYGWLHKDRSAATAWIQQSPLPNDVKQRMLEN